MPSDPDVVSPLSWMCRKHATMTLRVQCYVCNAEELADRLAAAERENDAQRERLQEWEDCADSAENPHADEVHCACVGPLTKRLKDLRAEGDAFHALHNMVLSDFVALRRAARAVVVAFDRGELTYEEISDSTEALFEALRAHLDAASRGEYRADEQDEKKVHAPEPCETCGCVGGDGVVIVSPTYQDPGGDEFPCPACAAEDGGRDA